MAAGQKGGQQAKRVGSKLLESEAKRSKAGDEKELLLTESSDSLWHRIPADIKMAPRVEPFKHRERAVGP